MRRQQEAQFAWALATAASTLLGRPQYDWLCVTLGAGDYTDAIDSLLNLYADRATPIPADLTPSVAEWFAGYVGAAEESRLRSLIERAGVALPLKRVTDVMPTHAHDVAPYANRPSRVTDSLTTRVANAMA